MESNKKKKKIAIIGHIDHDKTTLSAAISASMSSKDLNEPKIVEDTIEENYPYDTTIPTKLSVPFAPYALKSGQQNRRERRKQQRKNR